MTDPEHHVKQILSLSSLESQRVMDLVWSDPDERAEREAEWKCAYDDCRLPADFIVKRFTDGDLESEYLVCMVHEQAERS